MNIIKRLTLILLTAFISSTVFAQDITGSWKGVLKIQEMQIRVLFHIKKAGETYQSTMDSPDQGAKGIPVTSTSFENSTLKMTVANAGITYEGLLDNNDVINGTFKQGGQSFPLNLLRSNVEEKAVRPKSR